MNARLLKDSEGCLQIRQSPCQPQVIRRELWKDDSKFKKINDFNNLNSDQEHNFIDI
jgi:hypothetical protein